MDLIKEVNFSSNKKISLKVNILGIILLISLTLIRSEVAFKGYGFIGLLLILALFAVVIVLHEGIHGLFFWLFFRKVKFGAKMCKLGPVFYATSPNSIMSVPQCLAVTLSPQILTVVLLALSYINFVEPFPMLFACNAAANLGGGCADIYMMYIILRCGTHVKVEDTIDGIRIYKE